MGTKEDVVFFDEKGMVPSSSVKTIDDYLSESEKKWALIEAFRADPQKFFAEQTGIVDLEIELVEADQYNVELFQWMAHTTPFPRLRVSQGDFRRVSLEYRWRKCPRLAETLNRTTKLGSLGDGTIISFTKDGVQVKLPIINNEAGPQEGYLILHETIHAIREQYRHQG